MSAELIEQLEGAGRVLDRLAPPVTVDELQAAALQEHDRASLAPVGVPLGSDVRRSPSRRSRRTLAVIAAGAVVTVGGLAALADRDGADPVATAPTPAPTAGTMQPSMLDPITSGVVPTDVPDGVLPEDLVVRFGAELADASAVWVYDSASTDQVCFVRSDGGGHSAGCVDPAAYRAGLVWSLEGSGADALLWGLTPPSVPVTVTIGDRTVASDSNGLWYAVPPADASSFTITTPAGPTRVDIDNPLVTSTIPTSRTPGDSATAGPAPGGAMVLDQFPAALTNATGYAYVGTASASEPPFPPGTSIQRWYTTTMEPELQPRLKLVATLPTPEFPAGSPPVGVDASQVTVRGANAWLYDEPSDDGRTVIFQEGSTVFALTGYQLSDDDLLAAAEQTTLADSSSVGAVIDSSALPAGLVERAVGTTTSEEPFASLESLQHPVASVRWYNAKPDGALPGDGEPMLWLGWRLEDPDLFPLHRLDYDTVTDTTVHGVPAFIATNNMPAHLGVVWSEGGYTYTLGGWGLDKDTVIEAANQLRPATDTDWAALEPEPG